MFVCVKEALLEIKGKARHSIIYCLCFLLACVACTKPSFKTKIIFVIIFVYLVILFFHCLFAVRKEPIMYYSCISDLFMDCFVYLSIRFVPFILIYSCIYGSFCLFGCFYNMFSDCTWKVTIIKLFND